MTKSQLSNTLLALLVVSLLGCANVGRQFPSDEVTQIHIGSTSQADILRIFGSPWRTGIEDGMTTWTYGQYQYKIFGEPNSKDLVVRFDKHDMVISYTYSESVDSPAQQ